MKYVITSLLHSQFTKADDSLGNQSAWFPNSSNPGNHTEWPPLRLIKDSHFGIEISYISQHSFIKLKLYNGYIFKKLPGGNRFFVRGRRRGSTIQSLQSWFEVVCENLRRCVAHAVQHFEQKFREKYRNCKSISRIFLRLRRASRLVSQE